MKQPETGNTIAELRKKRGMTQEDLAYACDINVRTIQRIEKGEVEPRVYTLNLLSKALDYDFSPVRSNGENFWIMLVHISCIIPVIIVPLMVWVMKKDDFPNIEAHAHAALNFQISMFMYLFIAGFLTLLIIGLPIAIGLGLYIFFISIINTINAATGRPVSYPLSLHIIK